MIAVHVGENVIAITDEMYRGVHAALVTELLTSNLGELNWCVGCAFRHA